MTNFRGKWLLAFIVLSPIVGLGQSAEPVDIFSEQRVVLQAVSEAEQRRVIADALGSVLLRASGQSRLPSHPALTQAQRDPTPFLRAFELADSDILLPNAIGNFEPTHQLQMRFDSSSVIELLAAMDLPFWGSPRPQTLVVVAAPQGDWIDVVTDWSASSVVGELMQVARAQGLPLIWPNLDLDELRLLHPDDLFLGLQQPLQTMSERYSAPLVLGGYIDFDADEELWQAQWQLWDNQTQRFQTVSGETITDIIKPALEWVSDTLSAQYAIAAAGDMQEFVFRVHAIDSLAEQNQVGRYLLQLPGTEGIALEQIQGSSVVFRLQTRASFAQWMAWLTLESQLLPRSGAEQMEFDWRG